MRYVVRIEGREVLLELRDQGGLVVTPQGGSPQSLDLVESSSLASVVVEGRHREIEFKVGENEVLLFDEGVEITATVARAGPGGRAMSKRRATAADVKAPMPGLVVAIEVQEGDSVDAGQGVVVLEAMKMQNELRSPVTGTVMKVFVQQGTAVDKGQLLLRVEE
jgi:pyruvate carboxylase subunit B